MTDLERSTYVKNIKQFKKLELPLSNQALSKFYADHVERYLPRKTSLYCQNGGANLYKTTLNNTEYEMAVNIIEGYAPYPDEEPEVFYPTKIYFFHPKATMRESCIIIWIHSDSKLGELRDLGSDYDCFRRIRTEDYPLLPRKKGETTLTLVLKYCRENYHEMGIFGLTLQDNSYYPCGTNRKVKLQLSTVRQLLRQKPFYMKFGFRPQDPDTNDAIHRNLVKMDTIKVNDTIFLGSNFLTWLKSTEGIELDIDPNSLLSTALAIIINNDCSLFGRIYTKVAKYAGLEYLDDDYKLIFRTRSFSGGYTLK